MDETSTMHRPKLSPFRLSLKIRFMAGFLFIADFLSILLTQQTEMSSAQNQYNLGAYQPSAATLGLSRYIVRFIADRPCVSAFMIANTTSKQRNYQLLTCVKLHFGGMTNKNCKDIAPSVSIESFFHRGGSDHMITYGSGFAIVSVRSQLILGNEDDMLLLFDTIDDDQFTAVKYIHRLTFQAAAEWLCRRQGVGNEKWCSTQRAGEPKFTSTTKTKEIKIWAGRSGNVIENHTGLISTFENVNFPKSRGSFKSAVRSLISSELIQEEIGPGA